MTQASATHLVIIPSYNTGDRLLETVREARHFWTPVWVVIDGSTDGSGERLQQWGAADPDLRVIMIPRNGGKGAAVLAGLREAATAGFSHALIMDADGQHPAQAIPEFMARSISAPDALILGVPVFDASAPALRVGGRKISNWWANLETIRAGIGDSLFGFRVYPITPLRSVMERNRWMRGFDFDPEAAVRLSWQGLHLVNLPAPVRYFRPEEGGISHFHYWRDNALLTWMHVRLMLEFLWRLPLLLWRRLRSSRH
jgi:glycosyltransferase involved in cell wall biosynthesis